MLGNKKLLINLKGNKLSALERLQIKKVNRRLRKNLFAMDCRACGGDCNKVCFAMLRQYRVNEIELVGGKSDFLTAVDVTEREESVSINVYNQLLHTLSELKAAPASAETPTPSAKPPAAEEKTAAKTSSEPPAKIIPQKSAEEMQKFQAEIRDADPFAAINAGCRPKITKITAPENIEEVI